VDDFIKQLTPLLSPGDIIIDGGNSEYQDTARRVEECKKNKLLFVGSGVSGGEEGARYGPSLMPGGNPEAWPHIKGIFQSICARADDEPCCEWVSCDIHFLPLTMSFNYALSHSHSRSVKVAVGTL
jgi:6-phosphogluconate dehydrogenase